MATDLAIECGCGELRGAAAGLQASQVTRVVCHCSDCQMFAHHLGQAERVLDPHGGTEICQVSPRTVHFEQGPEQLACVRLTPKGPYRWYTRCCKSPVANTVPGLPFAGLIVPTVQPDAVGLGKVRAHIFGCDAIGDRATLQASNKIPPMLLLRVVRKLLFRRLRGDHKHSPFHDQTAGQAAARPEKLSADEREALESRRLAWGSTSS